MSALKAAETRLFEARRALEAIEYEQSLVLIDFNKKRATWGKMIAGIEAEVRALTVQP